MNLGSSELSIFSSGRRLFFLSATPLRDWLSRKNGNQPFEPESQRQWQCAKSGSSLRIPNNGIKPRLSTRPSLDFRGKKGHPFFGYRNRPPKKELQKQSNPLGVREKGPNQANPSSPSPSLKAAIPSTSSSSLLPGLISLTSSQRSSFTVQHFVWFQQHTGDFMNPPATVVHVTRINEHNVLAVQENRFCRFPSRLQYGDSESRQFFPPSPPRTG